MIKDHAAFADLYYRKEQAHWGYKYLQGLMLPIERTSIEPMALALDGGDVQAMQQCIGQGQWQDDAFLDGVAAQQRWYDAEVPHDTHVWLTRPATAVPAWSGRGRQPRKARVVPGEPAPQRVDQLAAAVPTDGWQPFLIKEGSTGPLGVEFAVQRGVMAISFVERLQAVLATLDSHAQAEILDFAEFLAQKQAKAPTGMPCLSETEHARMLAVLDAVAALSQEHGPSISNRDHFEQFGTVVRVP